MLARMLRFTIALQVALGMALAWWLLKDRATSVPLLTGMACAGLALPLLSSLLTVSYSFLQSRAEDEPAALWWRALAGECRASIRIFLLRQPWAFAPPALQKSGDPRQRLPVLLVHGFVCNSRIWEDLVPALRAQGHTVLAINLEPVFCPIDDYAPLLEQAVQTLRRKSGRNQVALLGHSMGGLAIRAWMRRYGTAHAARAITLGTPHAGTRIKALAAPLNALQMAWHSDWLQTLAASESEATRSLFRIALTAQDNIVYPQRAQTLAGVTPTVFEGLGHLQLCSAVKVRDWVCAELALL